jgi:hypothetical protein
MTSAAILPFQKAKMLPPSYFFFRIECNPSESILGEGLGGGEGFPFPEKRDML